MAPRGMRVITGREAKLMTATIDKLRSVALALGLEEIIIPSVWEQQTFVDKAGAEVLNQMYVFPDRKGRELCLIPEVTGVVQEWYRSQQGQPRAIFYVNRCYRYERPQAGRYREFTQFGVELLGRANLYGSEVGADEHARHIAQLMMHAVLADVTYTYSEAVKRGLSYYVADGFEYEVPSLGAQKQVLGGGRYAEGVGFAIGVDRVVLALKGETP